MHPCMHAWRYPGVFSPKVGCLLPPNWCRLFAAALSSRGGAEKLGAEAWHRFQRVFHGSLPPNIRRNNRGTANAQALRAPLLLAYDGDKRFDIISITGLIANKVWVSFWCTSSSTFKATENPLNQRNDCKAPLLPPSCLSTMLKWANKSALQHPGDSRLRTFCSRRRKSLRLLGRDHIQAPQRWTSPPFLRWKQYWTTLLQWICVMALRFSLFLPPHSRDGDLAQRTTG